MDLSQEIRRKTSALDGYESLDGVKAVIRHVETAERYLIRARDENEEDLFNDVVYRTNQAFEGMLKEAYSVLTSKDGNKLSPHQIEQHLLQEKVLAPRVLDLFKNYRQNWRNPSTHDHRLFFGEQEAFLAIVSVSAFTNILLDQLIEAVNFKREQEEIQRKKEQLEGAMRNLKEAPLYEQLLDLLQIFSNDLKNSFPDHKQVFEVEIIGRLNGFLESLYPTLTIVREPLISTSALKRLRPDMILRSKDETVLIEVKGTVQHKSVIERGRDQLLAYLEASQIQHGILYVPPRMDEKMGRKSITLEESGRKVSIHLLVPRYML